MTKPSDDTLGSDGPSELLPWFVAGTLPRKDADRVRAALDRNPDLTPQLRGARDDREATILSNEALTVPSNRIAENLFRQIAAEPARAQPRTGGVVAFFATLFGHSSRIPTFAAGAAALVIIAQAGVLTSVITGHDTESTYRSATGTEPVAGRGSFVLVGFAPGASAAQITVFLESFAATVVDGPRAGFYKLRISETNLPRSERDQILAKMIADSTVVESAKLTW